MRDDLEFNPYAPPLSLPAGEGLWRRFLRFLGVRPASYLERFRQGAYFGHYGVHFRIQPGDSAHVFAFVPWTNLDEGRARLNILEARRSLTFITRRHAEMKELVAGRALVVVQVPSYADLDDEIRRDVLPAAEWELNPQSDVDDRYDDSTSAVESD